jgi:small subunit ribosomal protein S6
MLLVREYETLYIIVPELGDDEQRKVIDSLNETIIKSGGEIIKSEVWGKRKLAYPIKKRTDGIYVLLRSRGGATLSKDVDIFIKRTPEILRHLTTVVTKQQLKEEARLRDVAAKRAEEARIAAEAAAKREAEAAEARAAQEELAASLQAEATPAETTQLAGSEETAEN